MQTVELADGTACDLRTALAALASRDKIVLAALGAGMPVMEVNRRSGLARTTIMRVRAAQLDAEGAGR
jgi:hypothetical protein